MVADDALRALQVCERLAGTLDACSGQHVRRRHAFLARRERRHQPEKQR
jgi:hypothetical protein